MLATELPPDVYYFAKLTPTDRSGTIWVVSILTLTYCLISAGVRFLLRRGMYGFDDLALLVSVFACIVQHAFVYIAVASGLGLAKYGIEDELSVFTRKTTYVRLLLAFLVHCLAKVSLTLFIRRLFYGQDRFNRVICNIMLAANISWGLLAILLMTVRCNSAWYFLEQQACPGVMTRWAIFKSFDVVTELALVFVPIFLLSRQLLNRRHKLIVTGTFAARLPVIFFTLMHYFTLKDSMHATHDRALKLVPPVVWLQVVLLWSMVTASLPSFKPLVSPFTKVLHDVDDQEPLDPALNGVCLMMGPQKSQSQWQGASLSTWKSVGGFPSQLEQVATTATWRADYKKPSDITIEGPRRTLFGMRKKEEEEVEMGTIQYDKFFELKYETAS